jgi:histidyl-tRNA synthetase
VKFQAIKGVRDILPPDSALWNRVEATAREVFETYGYGESRVPVIESTELFARSIGAETDVVAKEMYTFEDRDAASVTLRPEATASVVRAYIEHGLYNRPGNTKLYYMGPMFRRERPQKGRYRQFYQIGAELLGSSDHAALDAEVLEMLLAFFERVGLKGAVLSINSIGDKNCRPAYVERLRGELEKFRDRLGPDSQRRIETNPLRVLDSKIPEEQAVIALLPRIADHLCADCKAHYAKLRQELELRNITYQENWRLVRGLDYYMRTTFEITAPGLGSQDAVCGGGRYDGLVELLGGPATTKCIGFAIGTDRLVLSLQAQAAEAAKAAPAADSGAQKGGTVSNALPGAAAPAGVEVFLAWLGDATYHAAVVLARKLRGQGISVELPPVAMKFGKALNLASRLGARHAVILGEDELTSGQFTVKRLADGEQQKLSGTDLLEYLISARKS